MTDIIERAETALKVVFDRETERYRGARGIIRELVGALKAARAENERLSGELNELLIRNARRTGTW